MPHRDVFIEGVFEDVEIRQDHVLQRRRVQALNIRSFLRKGWKREELLDVGLDGISGFFTEWRALKGSRHAERSAQEIRIEKDMIALDGLCQEIFDLIELGFLDVNHAHNLLPWGWTRHFFLKCPRREERLSLYSEYGSFLADASGAALGLVLEQVIFDTAGV